MKDGPELLGGDVRNELHVAERVIVTQVAIEAASVCDEFLPLLWGQTLDTLKCSRLKLVEVLFCEVGLKDAPDEGLLVADLVQGDERSSPGRLRHVVSVVLLCLG